MVLGRSLAITLGLGLAIGLVAATSTASAGTPPRSGRAPVLFHKSRSFRIPFNVDPADRPRLKEVQLWGSEDSGFSWKMASRTPPDRPSFTFRATRDAEYWFAVRTLDNKGRVYPGEDAKVEPSMKVIVDTSPPSLVIESDGRRGSLASVRWEVRDEHLDLKSLVIEYQVEGGREWREVPIRRPALIGSESWDAGTAEPLRVRASVADRAGNLTEQLLSISEGTPANPALAGNEAAEYSAASPVSPISSGPTFPPDDSAPRNRAGNTSPSPNAAGDPFPFGPSANDRADASKGGRENVPPVATTGPGNDPFGNPADPGGSLTPPAEPAPIAPGAGLSPSPAAGGTGDGAGQTLLVPSPRFPLQYAVDDAGPNGPASVELWVTQDGGRTWYRRGEDPDHTSPFPVDLGGEGTYGLRLVARGASGLGDSPPAPGDPPLIWVEVDGGAPAVQLYPPVTGHGANLGKVAIRWRATDVNLGKTPVTLSWRPADQSNAAWQTITPQPIENTGQFIWTVPTSVPPRFHLRIEVADTAGNRGTAETSDGPPVLVDRTRPRSRIIGLDPSARTGMGPGARPLR